VLFLLDVSDSMGALERMAVTKGAVLALLQRAYQGRHQVALVSFGGNDARTVLGPTKSVLLAKKALSRLRPDGGTPLAAGLEKCEGILKTSMRRFPGMRRTLVIISDGEATVAYRRRGKPLEEAFSIAARIGKSGVHPVLIDTKLPEVGKENEMKQLHYLLGGKYINASAPAIGAILDAVEGP
jgi:Mg-chelatase subunit ChlD